MQPVINKVRNLSKEELGKFNLDVSADWQINPHFMNCSSGQITEKESQVSTVRHDSADINRDNLAFIQQYSGQTFKSFEDAQKFMLEDACSRPRPHCKALKRDLECEEDNEIKVMKWSFEVDQKLGE